MAEKTEVEVIVTPEGEIKIRVMGGPPGACDRLAKQMSENLGPIIAEEKTLRQYEHTHEHEKPRPELGR